MPTVLPNRLFLMTDQGVERVTLTREVIQDPEALLRAYQSDRPVTIRGGMIFDEDVYIARGVAHFALPIHELPLFAVHRPITLPDGTPAIAPCFGEREGATRMEMTWRVAAALPDTARAKLYLVVALQSSDGGFYQAGLGLVARNSDSRPTLYKLPLSNVHEDGHLCLGQVTQPRATRGRITIRAAAMQFYQTYLESNWNNDMRPNEDQVAAIFRFNPTDGATLPAHREWRQNCRPIANPLMDWLVTLT
jgi:hypothetical protein